MLLSTSRTRRECLCIFRITRQFKQQLSGNKNTHISNTSFTKAKPAYCSGDRSKEGAASFICRLSPRFRAMSFEICRRVTCQHKVAPTTLCTFSCSRPLPYCDALDALKISAISYILTAQHSPKILSTNKSVLADNLPAAIMCPDRQEQIPGQKSRKEEQTIKTMPWGGTICSKGQRRLCSRGDTAAEIFFLPFH